jgi:hypothetical protein
VSYECAEQQVSTRQQLSIDPMRRSPSVHTKLNKSMEQLVRALPNDDLISLDVGASLNPVLDLGRIILQVGPICQRE